MRRPCTVGPSRKGGDLAEVGEPGPRWDGAEPATLERILFHLVQEDARYLGRLDVVAELTHGQLGETRQRRRCV